MAEVAVPGAWFKKQPEKRGAAHRRWFMLKGMSLEYFENLNKDGQGVKLKGTIALGPTTVATNDGPNLSIKTPDRTYELTADTPAQSLMWRRLINDACKGEQPSVERARLGSQAAERSSVSRNSIAAKVAAAKASAEADAAAKRVTEAAAAAAKAAEAAKKMAAGVWLTKKAPGIGKSQRRWFVLVGQEFRYFELPGASGAGELQKGHIAIGSATRVTVAGAQLTVTNPDRTWPLSADTAEDAAAWGQRLEAVVHTAPSAVPAGQNGGGHASVDGDDEDESPGKPELPPVKPPMPADSSTAADASPPPAAAAAASPAAAAAASPATAAAPDDVKEQEEEEEEEDEPPPPAANDNGEEEEDEREASSALPPPPPVLQGPPEEQDHGEAPASPAQSNGHTSDIETEPPEDGDQTTDEEGEGVAPDIHDLSEDEDTESVASPRLPASVSPGAAAAPASPLDIPVALMDWFTKKAEKFGRSQRRLFCLKGKEITYVSDSGKILGSIPLAAGTDVWAAGNTLSIKTGKRTYQLMADDDETALRWSDVLRSQVSGQPLPLPYRLDLLLQGTSPPPKTYVVEQLTSVYGPNVVEQFSGLIETQCAEAEQRAQHAQTATDSLSAWFTKEAHKAGRSKMRFFELRPAERQIMYFVKSVRGHGVEPRGGITITPDTVVEAKGGTLTLTSPKRRWVLLHDNAEVVKRWAAALAPFAKPPTPEPQPPTVVTAESKDDGEAMRQADESKPHEQHEKPGEMKADSPLRVVLGDGQQLASESATDDAADGEEGGAPVPAASAVAPNGKTDAAPHSTAASPAPAPSSDDAFTLTLRSFLAGLNPNPTFDEEATRFGKLRAALMAAHGEAMFSDRYEQVVHALAEFEASHPSAPPPEKPVSSE